MRKKRRKNGEKKDNKRMPVRDSAIGTGKSGAQNGDDARKGESHAW